MGSLRNLYVKACGPYVVALSHSSNQTRISHLYISTLWQGLQLLMDTKKTCVTMKLDYVVII